MNHLSESDALRSEVYELAAACLAEELTDQQEQRLHDLVSENPDASRHYVRFISDTLELSAMAGRMELPRGKDDAPEETAVSGDPTSSDPASSDPLPDTQPRRETPKRQTRWWITVSAAAAVIMAVLGWQLLPIGYPAPVASGSYRVVGGEAIGRGVTLTTEEEEAKLVLGGYCEVTIEPHSEATIEGDKGEECVVLQRGGVVCDVNRSVGAFRVRTELGTVAVTGTKFEVKLLEKTGSVGKNTKELLVRVIEGSVLVSGATKDTAVKEGEERVFPALQPTRPPRLEKELAIDLGDGVEIKFVLIPAGEFMMGSSDAQRQLALEQTGADQWAAERIPTEGPQHKVKITKPFYLGKYEVTQEQWQAVMGNNPTASSFKGPMNPVAVRWEDVEGFVAKLNAAFEKKGMVFGLPTEAQWEYACRAGTTTAYSFGDHAAQLAQHGWSKANSGGTSHPVGQGKPNAWGLYDMHGNVWEWCSDWYGTDYYAKSPPADPTGPATGSSHIIRGGSWNHSPKRCRTAFRHHAQYGNRQDFGLRLTLVLEGK